ncbi:MAG: RNA 2'-phosphotransferase [Chloroflexota bacterium]|nr:RNA 2'-phosphotransferase [Chloroflexota bacterium]
MSTLERRQRKLSKFLSLLLRHQPARFPLRLDEEGYASLDAVMAILKGLPNFRWVNRADVDAVVNVTTGRRRFEIQEQRIRALYGHTSPRPKYEPVEPPATLYHGTAPENVERIKREGLRPMQRQYVHLATTPQIARSIGLRHSPEPVILEIDAARAYADGVAFHHPVAEIYLTTWVLARYIS